MPQKSTYPRISQEHLPKVGSNTLNTKFMCAKYIDVSITKFQLKNKVNRKVNTQKMQSLWCMFYSKFS